MHDQSRIFVNHGDGPRIYLLQRGAEVSDEEFDAECARLRGTYQRETGQPAVMSGGGGWVEFSGQA